MQRLQFLRQLQSALPTTFSSHLPLPPCYRAKVDDVRIAAPALAELAQSASVDFPPELLIKQQGVLVSNRVVCPAPHQQI